ncbi:PI-PLC X domain-containing protein 1 [Chaetomidium leptoderma]|uniref:PI-PLC X domain-containing protein 1 n=1 Tax=Chaetomidium leptoderma TaxID=669021 RepID=A0AAN6ZXH6_9PEZI|nr:PI-PLC X domain-containing protein 1 [Chaetomidium leptoderma]
MAPLKRIAGLLWLLSLRAGPALCQNAQNADDHSVDNAANADDVTILTGTRPDATKYSTGSPSGSYQTPSSRITIATSSLPTDLGPLTASYTYTSELNTVTYLTGSPSTTASGNGTASSTSTAPPRPTNTRPCNNYPELCARKYSNITHIGCHNSPFVRAGSAAANQQFPTVDQLNDGVRFLQAQMQWPVNGTTPHLCHTSCDLLDAGPLTNWLRQVRDWVAAHPYDVVTLLLGNGNYSNPEKYVRAIEDSGIKQFVYTPSVVPMAVDDWPTLGQMILSGQRVVMFLDYMANQTAYPWLMDQFSQMWESPFDPVDTAFPCTVQRPPDLKPEEARRRLYMMNHNLNVEVSLLGQAILVPAVSQLNVTNGVEGVGSLGMAANNCRTDWGRAPNILNVDYYNFGSFPGSVFEVAAMMNNVSFERRPCCGPEANAGLKVEVVRSFVWMGLAWMGWMLV